MITKQQSDELKRIEDAFVHEIERAAGKPLSQTGRKIAVLAAGTLARDVTRLALQP